MLHVSQSHRTESLLADLVARVAALRREKGPFEPIRLVVPNRNIGSFLRLGIAEALGIAIHCEVLFLSHFVESLASASSEPFRVIGRQVLEGPILECLLDDEVLSHPDATRLRAWLHGAGDSQRAIDERRRELAQRLAWLFEEYALSRPEWLRDWLEDAPMALPAQALWQRHVWRKLAGKNGLFAQREAAGAKPLLTYDALFRRLRASSFRAPGEYHIFGFSYVARGYHDLLRSLAEHTEIHLYSLNPSQEFWEDAGPASGELDNPLLANWGRPGRENIALWNEATGFATHDLFIHDEAPSHGVLATLQQDVLFRRPPQPLQAGNDGSIKFIAAPNAKREAEEIVAEIWRRLQQPVEEGAQPLRLHEIAIAVNPQERDTYLPHLTAALREAHQLPHQVVDISLATESRMVTSMLALLSLADGAFERAPVLRLLTHPCLLAKFPELDGDHLVTLVTRLGIVGGVDNAQFKNSYLERDHFNWDQGLRRLALGTLMNEGTHEAPRHFEIDGEAYLPAPENLTEREAAALFSRVMRSLFDDLAFTSASSFTPKKWAEFFRCLWDSYLAPTNESEERDRVRVLSELRALSELDIGEREISFWLAADFVRARLHEIDNERGHSVAGGIVISSLLPMRAIPFRLVCVVGLNEASFPARDTQDPLDLRINERRVGDVSPRERDQYLLLEALLSARDAIVLSYVRRNEVTGEPLAPSAVTDDLATLLQHGYGLAREAFVREPALRPLPAVNVASNDNNSKPVILSERAHREAAIATMRPAVMAQVQEPRLAEALHRARALLSPEERLAIEHVIVPENGRKVHAYAPLRTRDEPIRFASLRKFLECPLQGSAVHRLGLSSYTEDDPFAVEHEPFAMDRRDRTRLLTDAFLKNAEPEAAMRQLAALLDREASAARAPSGLFASLEVARYGSVFATWADTFAREPQLAWERFERVVFGPEARPTPRAFAVPEFALTDSTFSLIGSLGLTDRSRAKTIRFDSKAHRGKEALAADLPRAVIAMMEHAALVAAGLVDETLAPSFHIVYGVPGKIVHSEFPFEPISKADSMKWLTSLAADISSDRGAFVLPIEAVVAWYIEKGRSLTDTVAKIIDGASDSDYGTISSLRGPVSRVESYPLPTEEEARASVIARLAPAFGRYRGLHG